MKKIKILFLSLNLFSESCILSFYKKIITFLSKRKNTLSKPTLIFISKKYENLLYSWSKKELNFILLILTNIFWFNSNNFQSSSIISFCNSYIYIFKYERILFFRNFFKHFCHPSADCWTFSFYFNFI